MKILYFCPILLLLSSCFSATTSSNERLVGEEDICMMKGIPSRFSNMELDKAIEQTGKDSAKMILIEGGVFTMGSNYFDDALPLHTVELESFWMDEHEVTNRQFAKFVAETNYVTVAERPLNEDDFPGVDPSLLVEGSAVFQEGQSVSSLQNSLQWWAYVPGASWKHPLGPDSSIEGLEDHPVVQIAYEDAVAYAEWAGKRLPTEAEWEYAAKGGKHTDEQYYWGEELQIEGKWMANIYQGQFPSDNTAEDGFLRTAPVKSFAPNHYGLYDMEGNVWEWCFDYYTADYYAESPRKNPQGPVSSHDPMEPSAIKRVQRGGSFLCSDQYCERYKAGGRGKGEINSPTNNVGFRCVKDI